MTDFITSVPFITGAAFGVVLVLILSAVIARLEKRTTIHHVGTWEPMTGASYPGKNRPESMGHNLTTAQLEDLVDDLARMGGADRRSPDRTDLDHVWDDCSHCGRRFCSTCSGGLHEDLCPDCQ